MEGAKLLIVDDDFGIREMLKLVFELEDFQVYTASNGAEALEQLRRIRPVMILLDLMMPVMNGWEFLEAQRKDPSIANIPVVVVTAFNQEEQFPANVVLLRKPVEVDQLIDLATTLSPGRAHE